MHESLPKRLFQIVELLGIESKRLILVKDDVRLCWALYGMFGFRSKSWGEEDHCTIDVWSTLAVPGRYLPLARERAGHEACRQCC